MGTGGFSLYRVIPSLVPRPLPDFISIFHHGCEIKSGSGLGMRLVNTNYEWPLTVFGVKRLLT